jgi:hypothetical protein
MTPGTGAGPEQNQSEWTPPPGWSDMYGPSDPSSIPFLPLPFPMPINMPMPSPMPIPIFP